MKPILYKAYAKINLNLHITGRRHDGYHTLDSHMVFTQWGDAISITPSNEISFTVNGSLAHTMTGALLSTDRDSPNLIIRALYAMCDAAHETPNIAIELTKEIPSGAGLGGGSSDAAATMLALNELWGHPLTPNQLANIGLELGAELPVCLNRRPARVQGIGDIVKTIHDAPIHYIVITWPNASLSTANVFQSYAAKNGAFDAPLNAISIHDLGNSHNGLQITAMDFNNDIEILINTLNAQHGCILARMTGSGSACFGVFETLKLAQAAVAHFDNAIATQTID